MKSAQYALFKFILFILALPFAAHSEELRLTSGHARAVSALTCAQVLEPSVLSFQTAPLNLADLPALSELTGFSIPFLKELVLHRSVLKSIRDGYNTDVKAISQMVEASTKDGKSLEQIAKKAHQMRRQFGLKYKDQTPASLRKEIYARNLDRYNDELGPTFKTLVQTQQQRGVSKDEIYRRIIQSSQAPNTKLNELIDLLSQDRP